MSERSKNRTILRLLQRKAEPQRFGGAACDDTEGVFTDVLFDGRSYQLKMPFTVSIRKSDDFDPDFFRIAFSVEHLSKEYYNYLNTRDQGELGFQIWAEPIQTYSNVTNGFGVVAGRAAETLWFSLPLEEP